MRLDEILEDVSQITDAAQKATAAVEGITSAPMDVVTGVTKKVRAKIKPTYASKESRELGEKKVTEGGEGTARISRAGDQNPIAQLADAAIDAASEVISEQRERRSEEKRAQAASEAHAAAQEAELNHAADAVVEQSVNDVDKDTPQAN
jgi:hypothetical protein